MPAPWQKYGGQQSAAAPWAKYGGTPAANAAPAAPVKPAGSMSAPSSPYAYYDPTFRQATGTDDPSSDGIGHGVANFLADAQQDPGGVASAGAAGFNRGVAYLGGMPMDFASNVTDLLGAGYGLGMGKITGRPAGEFYEPLDRSRVPLTGEWNANMLDKGAAALGGGPATQNPSPNNLAARLMYSTAQGVPGALTGRAMVAGAAGGGAQGIVSEAGGDAAAQGLAGLLGGRAIEHPQSPRRPNGPEPVGGNFAPDSGGAAAAMPPMLDKVPREMRGPLVLAVMRGDRDMAHRVLDAETLPVPIKMMEGQARANSTMMADEFNLRGTDKAIAGRFDEQNQGLIENLDTIRREVAPNAVGSDHVQNGQTILDAYKAADEPVRAQITEAYQALEKANGGQLPINARSFVDAADAALAKKLKARYLPAEVRGDLDQFRDAGGMMTFEQYENLRTNLATAARDADRGTLKGGGNAAAAIRLVRDALEDMPMEGVGAELKPLADRARQLARERFERIRKDPAYEAAVDDPTPAGELSPFADEFVRKYVVKGKAANLNQMRENLSSDPQASEAIAAAALNYVKQKAGVNLNTNEGNFSQKGYNDAIAELAPRLRTLVPPKVAETLEQLGRVAHDLQRQRRGGNFNNSGTAGALIKEATKGYAENALNTVVPGAQLGTGIRKQRDASRERKRIQRALNPIEYLSTKADDE
jgi:hypothetical protein